MASITTLLISAWRSEVFNLAEVVIATVNVTVIMTVKHVLTAIVIGNKTVNVNVTDNANVNVVNVSVNVNMIVTVIDIKIVTVNVITHITGISMIEMDTIGDLTTR